MQALREEQQENAKRNREAFDKLEDEYREERQQLFDKHEVNKRLLKEKKTETQHAVERKMHELKVQWAKEHPIDEVKVVNND